MMCHQVSTQAFWNVLRDAYHQLNRQHVSHVYVPYIMIRLYDIVHVTTITADTTTHTAQDIMKYSEYKHGNLSLSLYIYIYIYI